MKKNKDRKASLIALIIMLPILTSIIPFPIDFVKAQSSSVYHTFSVDPESHNNYGLAYPVTYEFSIPDDASNLKAYKRFTLEESWVQIVDRTSNDFFNGIEAVRFDYANNRAYVSISFASYSDCIYIYFTNSGGNEISTQYLGVTEYYDDRRVAVVFTIDDIGGEEPWGGGDYAEISGVFANAEVWWTGGIITSGMWAGSWQILQECLDRGYFEVASHSCDHPHPPYDDYDYEVGGSRNEIITNLALPYPYKKGNAEYVWCWIEPFGESDDVVQYTLGEYNYLISRTTYETLGPTYYEEWNSAFGIYDRAFTSVYMDYRSVDEINDVFDSVYAAGGIYHAWGHPGLLGWGPEGNAYEHIQYVKGKKDVWYVGFGALYAYAYTRIHVNNMSVAVTPTQVKMYVGQSQTFSSFVSGGVPPYTYQWYLNDTQVSGATSSIWVFTPTTPGRYNVYLKVTDSLNIKTQSNVVRDIFVYSQLSVSISPVSVNMTVGTSQTFSSTVSGGAPPYSYQWYRNGTTVPGTTGATWTFTPTSAGTYIIYLRVADDYTATAQSNSAIARVSPPLIVTITPAQVKMYVGQSQTFSSTVTGGTPPYTYQWYQNGTAMPSATSSTWTFTPTSTGRYEVYVMVTDDLNIQAQSNVVTDVHVYSAYLLLTAEPNQATYMSGESVTFTVDVFNQLNPPLNASLTLTVTGPDSYGFYDSQPIDVSATTIREYRFTWTSPYAAGTYIAEVELVPSQLTAYDTLWLNVA